MRKTKKITATLAIVAMMLTMIPMQAFAAGTDDTRIAGTSRIQTAIAAADAGWTSADTAILAPAADKNLVDALAAAPLAGQEDAPILLTEGNELNADTKAELVKLGVSKVYVVGAIDAAVTAEVEAMDGVEAVALKGANRNATAALIAEELTSPAGTFVVGYDANADALSVASYAAANNYAIILAGPDGKLAADQKVYGTKTYVVGGTLKVADIAGATRLSGTNRYDTNKAVLNGLSYEYSKVYVANGENGHLVDSLIASSLAAKTKSPILLTDNKTVAAATDVNKNLKSDSKVIALGGTSVVSDTVKGGVKYTAPAALAVESVSAINAKQVQVVFNQEVSKAVAEDVANYDIFRAADLTTDVFTTTASGANAALQADNKTVILTLDSAIAFVNYSSTNKLVVKTGVGLAADYTNAAVAVSDTAVPTVLSASATGSNQITVKFSEPVNSAGVANVVLNDGTFGINLAGAAFSQSANTMVINTYTNMTPGATYTLKVKAANGIADSVGYAVAPATVSFTYTPATAAPVYTVKSSTEKSVTIEFASPILANTLVNNAAVLVTHTYNNATNQVTGAAITNPTGDAKTFVITFANPLPPGASTMYMAYATGTLDASKVKDAYGNIVPLTNLTVNTVADVVAPTATVAMAANSNTQINVTFSEAVTPATVVAGNFTLKDSAGNVVPFTGPTATGVTNQYSLTTAALSGAYTLEIKNITDTSIAANKMTTTTYPVTVADTIKPFVVTEAGAAGSNYYTQADAKNVRIYFSEAMDATSLSDVTKYVNGGANPTSATPAADAKSVALVFAANTSGNLYVGAVKDQAGNLLTNLGATLTSAAGSNVGLITPTVAIPNKAIAESTTTVKVYLNDLVQNVTTQDFQVSTDSGSTWVYPATFTQDNTSGKTVLTLILAPANAFDAAVTGVQVRTANAGAAGATANAVNAYGKAVQFTPETVVDKVLPTVNYVTFQSANRIDVTFTEALNSATVALAGVNGFSVSGGTLTSAFLSASNKTITLTGTNFTADTDVVYSGTNIADVSGNKLAAFTYATAATAATFAVVNSPADNTFTTAINFDAPALVVGDIDMDAAAGVQAVTTINGVTYTATEASGVITITAAGNSTATLAATTANFTITRNGIVKTVVMGIPASTAGAAGASPTVAAQ